MNKNSLIYTVVFTFLTAFFFVFFLSLADGATADLVRRNRISAVQGAILRSLDIDDGVSGGGDTAEAYGKIFDRVPAPGEILSTRLEGRELKVLYFTGSGLWGTITGILAVDSTVDRILGMDIIGHNETPGLGGRIDEDWFKDQFRGEAVGSAGITVRKGAGGSDGDPDNGEVDGVTGASLTSASVQTIINNALAELKGGK